MWLCDDEKSARIVLPTGETVKPKPRLQIVATMKREPEDLPEAIQDRFSARIRISAPHPEAIASLPENLRPHATKLTHENTPLSQRVSIASSARSRKWSSWASRPPRRDGLPSIIGQTSCWRRSAGDGMSVLIGPAVGAVIGAVVWAVFIRPWQRRRYEAETQPKR